MTRNHTALVKLKDFWALLQQRKLWPIRYLFGGTEMKTLFLGWTELTDTDDRNVTSEVQVVGRKGSTSESLAAMK